MKKYTEKELLKIMIKARKIETIYLDNSQMKQLFNVADKTLYRWRKAEKLVHLKQGGKFYYPLHMVMNMMQAK